MIHILHFIFFFFNDTATTEIYTLSLHDALPISTKGNFETNGLAILDEVISCFITEELNGDYELELEYSAKGRRSEEHTSELQSRQYLVCRLLLEKKKKKARQ